MNPLIVLTVTMAGLFAVVYGITRFADDTALADTCSILGVFVSGLYCLAFLAIALHLSGASVSAKLWNQQHGTNYSATEWFYAADRITGDKQ